MRIKVIIHDGIVTEVLSDGPAEVEIIDIYKDYEDYDALCAREKEVLADKDLGPVEFMIAHFDAGET